MSNKLRRLIAIGKAIGKAILAIIGALGAVACILVWLEVRPKDVRIMTWPHGLWLVGALLLFAISLSASLRSLYLAVIADKRFSAKIASINQANTEQIARINKQHESDEFRIRQARDEITAELRAARAANENAPQFSDLAKRTLNLASRFRQEVKQFRAEHPQPRFPSRLSRSIERSQVSSPMFRDDDVDKAIVEFNAWKQRAGGWYCHHFMRALQDICNELAATGAIDNQLSTAITETSLDEENTAQIIRRLRYLALQLDDDPSERALLAANSGRDDLEVRLRCVAHGSSIDVNGSTLFFKLGVFSEIEAGLRRIAIHLKINGKHYELEPIEELTGWKREAPLKPPQPYHSIMQSNMGDSDLRKSLRGFGIHANKEVEGYVAAYVPELIPKIIEKIQLVRLDFSITGRSEPYSFTFTEIREDEATIRPES